MVRGGGAVARPVSLSNASLQELLGVLNRKAAEGHSPPALRLPVPGTLPGFHKVNSSSYRSYIESRANRALTRALARLVFLPGRRDPNVPDPHTLRITRSASEPAGAYRILGLLVMRCTRRPRFRCSLLVKPRELMLPRRSASGSMVLAETEHQEQGRDVRTGGTGHLGWLNRSRGTG